MQLRSEICKHFESWSADSPRRVKDLFTVLRETSPSADEQQPTKAPSPPPMDWTRKPLKK